MIITLSPYLCLSLTLERKKGISTGNAGRACSQLPQMGPAFVVLELGQPVGVSMILAASSSHPTSQQEEKLKDQPFLRGSH